MNLSAFSRGMVSCSLSPSESLSRSDSFGACCVSPIRISFLFFHKNNLSCCQETNPNLSHYIFQNKRGFTALKSPYFGLKLPIPPPQKNTIYDEGRMSETFRWLEEERLTFALLTERGVGGLSSLPLFPALHLMKVFFVFWWNHFVVRCNLWFPQFAEKIIGCILGCNLDSTRLMQPPWGTALIVMAWFKGCCWGSWNAPEHTAMTETEVVQLWTGTTPHISLLEPSFHSRYYRCKLWSFAFKELYGNC